MDARVKSRSTFKDEMTANHQGTKDTKQDERYRRWFQTYGQATCSRIRVRFSWCPWCLGGSPFFFVSFSRRPRPAIHEFGSLFRSPWKRRFFTLLGELRHLDDVEHGLIRAPGVFDKPRIHMAVNCASVGCPALRDEAFVAQRLEAQLGDGAVRFLSDRNRNRHDAASGVLYVSRIFDWHGKGFKDEG
jgi:hypothetical protein